MLLMKRTSRQPFPTSLKRSKDMIQLIVQRPLLLLSTCCWAKSWLTSKLIFYDMLSLFLASKHKEMEKFSLMCCQNSKHWNILFDLILYFIYPHQNSSLKKWHELSKCMLHMSLNLFYQYPYLNTFRLKGRCVDIFVQSNDLGNPVSAYFLHPVDEDQVVILAFILQSWWCTVNSHWETGLTLHRIRCRSHEEHCAGQ